MDRLGPRFVPVCRSALVALGGLLEAQPEIVEDLIEIMRRRDPESDFAAVIAGLLGADAGAAIDELIILMTTAPQNGTRVAATLALGDIGIKDPRVLAALEAQIKKSQRAGTGCRAAFQTLRELSYWRAWRVGHCPVEPNVKTF